MRLAALAERYFADDPNTCLIKLRQFTELLAQSVAAKLAKTTLVNGRSRMQTLSAKYGFGRPIDLARAEPVTVAKDGHPGIVVMAVEEFNRLRVLDTAAMSPERKARGQNDN